MQLENGTYRARPVSGEGAASVYESKGGALMLAQKFAIDGGPTITSQTCLVNKSGAVTTRTLDDLKSLFGWNGVDPTWFMETDLSGVEVDLVIENEEYEGKVYPKVKWVNKPGAGGGYKLPESADKKALLAKYGSKFRALAGPQPAATRTPPPPATKPPARPAPATTAAAPAKKASSQATAWALLQEKAGTISQDQVEKYWFGFIDATGMDQAEMTPEGWAQVEAAIIKQSESEGGFLPF